MKNLRLKYFWQIILFKQYVESLRYTEIRYFWNQNHYVLIITMRSRSRLIKNIRISNCINFEQCTIPSWSLFELLTQNRLQNFTACSNEFLSVINAECNRIPTTGLYAANFISHPKCIKRVYLRVRVCSFSVQWMNGRLLLAARLCWSSESNWFLITFAVQFCSFCARTSETACGYTVYVSFAN